MAAVFVFAAALVTLVAAGFFTAMVGFFETGTLRRIRGLPSGFRRGRMREGFGRQRCSDARLVFVQAVEEIEVLREVQGGMPGKLVQASRNLTSYHSYPVHAMLELCPPDSSSWDRVPPLCAPTLAVPGIAYSS